MNPPAAPAIRTPLIETDTRDGLLVVGVAIPHEPADVSDAIRPTTYMVHTRPNVTRQNGHDAKTLTEAARLLVSYGVRDYVIYAHTETRDEGLSCEWNPLSRSWSRWARG